MVLCLPVAPAARSPGAQMRGKADSTRLARMDWEGPVPAQGVEAYSVVRKHVTWRQAGICSPASRRPPGAHCEPVWEAHCLCSPPARPRALAKGRCSGVWLLVLWQWWRQVGGFEGGWPWPLQSLVLECVASGSAFSLLSLFPCRLTPCS